jgi:putative ABC transport system permease protein
MKKVGMTGKDIRKNVNSQMKTVFYMPLIMAILHLAFAFPIIFRILTLFGLINLSVQITTAVVSAVLFGVLYTVVYNFTSNSYYKLVR